MSRMPELEKPFYVYTFRHKGRVIYVGKGTKRRFSEQVKSFSYKPDTIGGIVRFFVSERAAYDYEAKLIAKHKPELNANRGGGGALTRIKQPKWWRDQMRDIASVGTRVYAARELLKFDLSGSVEPSKIDEIRRVAYG